MAAIYVNFHDVDSDTVGKLDLEPGIPVPPPGTYVKVQDHPHSFSCWVADAPPEYKYLDNGILEVNVGALDYEIIKPDEV